MVSGNRPLVEVAHSAYIFKLRHLFTSRHSYANCWNLLYTVWYKSLLRRDGENRSIDITQNLVEHFHFLISPPQVIKISIRARGQPSMHTT